VNRVKDQFPDIWVATSKCDTDDLLAEIFLESEISVYRGSLNNVLERFCNICDLAEIKRDDVVIRLTGDNPIVDGGFIKEMQKIWESKDLEYLSAEPPDNDSYGWPKGLSVEFVKAELLYEARKSVDRFDIEHVTPYARRNSRSSMHMASVVKFEHIFTKSFGVDTLADYLFVAGLFKKLSWDASYDEILKKGAELTYLDL